MGDIQWGLGIRGHRFGDFIPLSEQAFDDIAGWNHRLAALSAETDLYPDLGFGTKHVNVTVYGVGGGPPGTEQTDFATRAAALAFVA